MILRSTTYMVFVSVVITSIFLLMTNVYGLFQDIRTENIISSELRFENDVSLSYEEFISQYDMLDGETDKAYSERLSVLVSQSLAHIDWFGYKDTKYNQLIPFWENYILFLMGKFSNIPEFKRYHFIDYKKSIQRGVGVCGDASMIMSEVLNKAGISNKIISFPGHVVVAVKHENNETVVYDPDFGVKVPLTPDEIWKNPVSVNTYYSQKGYTNSDLKKLSVIFAKKYKSFDGVKGFMKKKYYFEYISYWLIWLIPIVLLSISFYALSKSRRQP
jgi:hypothetical protein